MRKLINIDRQNSKEMNNKAMQGRSMSCIFKSGAQNIPEMVIAINDSNKLCDILLVSKLDFNMSSATNKMNILSVDMKQY